MLKALVGDVILETRQFEGQPKPQMVARFSINAEPATAAGPAEAIVPLIYDRRTAARKPRTTASKS